MPSKTRRNQRRRNLKHRKGGSIDYKKLRIDLLKDQSFEGAKKTYEYLKEFPDSGPSQGVGHVRDGITMLMNNQNMEEDVFNQILYKTIENLDLILIKLSRS